MNPEIKKILNALKCPLCKAPIDLIEYSSARKGYNFGCAINVDHYAISLIYDPVMVAAECIHIHDAHHMYEIIKHPYGKVRTTIKIFNTDAESRVIFSFKEKQLDMDIDAFNFDKLDLERAINRIKTIFLFQ